MQKTARVILIISISINILLGLIFLRTSEPVEPLLNEYIERIDSLENDIKNLQSDRDSVKVEIDTVYSSLKSASKQYEKVYNTIIKYSVNDDYCYFTSYIEWNRERLDSTNNSESTQGN